MTAMTDLNDLLTPLPGSTILTDNMRQSALERSLVPDSYGVWPGQAGYIPTYDTYWAAMSLIGFLRAQPVIRQTSSEGTSVAVDAPDWGGVLSYYRSQSVIAAATGAGGVLGVVAIPDTMHIQRVDMSRAEDGSDDVDTDIG